MSCKLQVREWKKTFQKLLHIIWIVWYLWYLSSFIVFTRNRLLCHVFILKVSSPLLRHWNISRQITFIDVDLQTETRFRIILLRCLPSLLPRKPYTFSAPVVSVRFRMDPTKICTVSTNEILRGFIFCCLGLGLRSPLGKEDRVFFAFIWFVACVIKGTNFFEGKYARKWSDGFQKLKRVSGSFQKLVLFRSNSHTYKYYC